MPSRPSDDVALLIARTRTTELIAGALVTDVYRYAGGPVALRLIHEQSHHICAAPVPPTRAGAALVARMAERDLGPWADYSCGTEAARAARLR
ncbi:hypothetical protein [Streptomyces sp. NPDC002676]